MVDLGHLLPSQSLMRLPRRYLAKLKSCAIAISSPDKTCCPHLCSPELQLLFGQTVVLDYMIDNKVHWTDICYHNI